MKFSFASLPVAFRYTSMDDLCIVASPLDNAPCVYPHEMGVNWGEFIRPTIKPELSGCQDNT